MLLAACHGLISVIKFFAPQVNINYKNHCKNTIPVEYEWAWQYNVNIEVTVTM